MGIAIKTHHFKGIGVTAALLFPTLVMAQNDADVPIYEQGWFYVGLLFLIIIGLVLSSLLRTRRLSSSKRKLEDLVYHRTLELIKKQEQLEQLSFVASEISDGVLIAESDGTLIWANDSFERMSGYNLNEYCASYGDNYFQSTGSEIIKTKGKEALMDGELTYETSYTSKHNEQKWTLCTVNPVKNDFNEIVKIILIYTDITEQKQVQNLLMRKNKDITDSIHYAKQIQEAILPDKTVLFKSFPESFIFYRPKDIVSGDFYWFTKIGEVFIVVAADCTGHGVPGAMMSMMGNEYLHQIVNNGAITGPDQALMELDEMIKRSLHQHGDNRESKDGIDLGIAAIHLETGFCQFAGAQNPLYLVRNDEIITYEGAKESVGGFTKLQKNFYSHEFNLQKGDTIYMATDGFMDQFGGAKGKKYYRKRFKDLLLNLSKENMGTQQIRLSNEFDQWKGNLNQVDDVLVMGLKF